MGFPHLPILLNQLLILGLHLGNLLTPLNNGLRKFRNSHAIGHAIYNGYPRASRLMAYKSRENQTTPQTPY
ncbi:hypothetical protein D3C85_1780850 [compost metagenome]